MLVNDAVQLLKCANADGLCTLGEFVESLCSE